MARELLRGTLAEHGHPKFHLVGQHDFHSAARGSILNGIFSGIYGMDDLFHPGLLSHSCGLSPSITDLEVIILLRAAPRGLLMKRALKKIVGDPFMGVWFGMFFIRAVCRCGNFNLLGDCDIPNFIHTSIAKFG